MPSKKPAGPSPVLDAVGITALNKSQSTSKQRDLLAPGSHDIKLSVAGTIDGQTWSREIAKDTAPLPASTTPWAELLESALTMVTEKQRRKWLDEVAKGTVPATTSGEKKFEAVKAELKPAVTSYRAANPEPKRGTVSFTPA